MRNIYFPFFILILVFFICYLNYRLSVRWIPQFRMRPVKYGFWLLTAAAGLIIGYSWSTRLVTELVVADWYRFAGYGAFAWLIGQAFFLVTLPLLYALQRLLAPIPQPEDETDEPEPALTRRAFLKNSLIGLPAMAIGISAIGVSAAESSLLPRRHTLRFPGLPHALSGLKIAQISDTHIGPYFPLEKLDRLIAAIKQEKPDILVMTGDIVDDLSLLTPAMKKISSLEPHIKHGIFFCWGNHEYFRNINRIHSALQQTPVKILNNAGYPAIPGQTPLYILGVDYPRANNPADQQEKRRIFLSKTLENVPPDSFRILISHHPDFINNAFAAGIPLTLAGHTHGGQLVIFGKPLLPFRYTYMRGLYTQNGCYGYVNSGAGHWFPFRLGCPPEYAVFTLNK